MEDTLHSNYSERIFWLEIRNVSQVEKPTCQDSLNHGRGPMLVTLYRWLVQLDI